MKLQKLAVEAEGEQWDKACLPLALVTSILPLTGGAQGVRSRLTPFNMLSDVFCLL